MDSTLVNIVQCVLQNSIYRRNMFDIPIGDSDQYMEFFGRYVTKEEHGCIISLQSTIENQPSTLHAINRVQIKKQLVCMSFL